MDEATDPVRAALARWILPALLGVAASCAPAADATDPGRRPADRSAAKAGT
jgi:hypothetical protein